MDADPAASPPGPTTPSREPVGSRDPELARLERQVRELRLLVLRAACLVAVALIALGLVLPAWTVRQGADHERVVYRIATAGFEVLGEDDGGAIVGTGFLGLLLVAVLEVGILVNSVVAGGGRSKNRWARTTIASLAVVGTLVPLLFSVMGVASHESGDSGGWGPLLLLVGLVVAAVLQAQRSWRDLWLDRPGVAGSRT
ncbi:hypothetical protein GCM10027596_29630 [Nocardioides korecus]